MITNGFREQIRERPQVYIGAYAPGAGLERIVEFVLEFLVSATRPGTSEMVRVELLSDSAVELMDVADNRGMVIERRREQEPT
jgi:DNA gyrase/topoisomerase IV subunit B